MKAHRRVKITKDHTLKEKDEAEAKTLANAQSRTVFCNIHTNEQCTLFCETCEQVTCRDCQLNKHRDHKYKFVHEIASETRCNISGIYYNNFFKLINKILFPALLKEVTYKRVLLKSAMKVIDDRHLSIMDKKALHTTEMSQVCVQIVEAVKSKLNILIESLSEVNSIPCNWLKNKIVYFQACDAKQRTLTDKKKALENLSKLTDHCISFVTDALDKGSDLALLYSKKTITSHLQRIKSRRADIPNPEIPVRISVAYKLQELLNGISFCYYFLIYNFFKKKAINNLATVTVDNRVLDDGNRTPTLENQSPPPGQFSHPSPNYQNQYAGANGNARSSHTGATPPLPSRTRASPVHQYQVFKIIHFSELN